MTDFPVIPGFRCDAVLGRGGMAVVYAATELSLGRRVAIKVVTAEDGDTAQHVRRLEQEAIGLAALQHPHIVELHSFGRTRDGSLYYVMPQFNGGDLTRSPKPLEEARLRGLLEPLLGALGHAHAAGIVHRDIKPANILFDRYERPLLGDFGAAFVRGAGRITDGDMAIGSSHYMSPEQSRGHEVDARTDLYSLGVLAFEYLTGRLPFDGDDDLAIALAKLEQPVPRLPRELGHWQSFFDRSLAVDPDARYASADEMRVALPLPAPAQPVRALRARSRVAVPIALVVLGALAFGVAYLRWLMPESPPPPLVANAPAAVPEPVASLHEIVGAPPPVDVAPTPTPADASAGLPVDAGGPALVTVAGLAVTRAPVDAALYRRFLERSNRPLFECPAAPQPAQGCIGPPEAERFAAWLSQETGAKYRLPTRAELASVVPRLARVPARAWSSSCDDASIAPTRNVARRAWSGVRQAFVNDRSRSAGECSGYFAVALDGRGTDVQSRGRAGPDTVVVLVRDDNR